MGTFPAGPIGISRHLGNFRLFSYQNRPPHGKDSHGNQPTRELAGYYVWEPVTTGFIAAGTSHTADFFLQRTIIATMTGCTMGGVYTIYTPIYIPPYSLPRRGVYTTYLHFHYSGECLSTSLNIELENTVLARSQQITSTPMAVRCMS